jgi:hypothetical protein
MWEVIYDEGKKMKDEKSGKVEKTAGAGGVMYHGTVEPN